MNTQTKVRKCGRGLAVPIPAAIARKLRIVPGTPIEVEERSGVILIKPARPSSHKLANILRSCKKKFPRGNPHGVVEFGPPVGKEVW